VSERRQYRRLDTNLVANIRTARSDDTQIREMSTITNLSSGGVFITTPYPFPLGAFVEFDFAIPGSSEASIHVKGVVRWSNPSPPDPGMGIEFIEVTSGNRDQLQSYVDVRIVEEYVRPLTQTPAHQSLLRLYYRKIGDSFAVDALALFLGMEREDLDSALVDFEGQGLVASASDKVSFLPPPDEQSDAAIRKWLDENPAS
jgi:uncharacterized protein (TIGR02266 family)